MDVCKAPDMNLVGAVSRTYAGKNLKDMLDETRVNVFVSRSVPEALETPTDVLVDYTSPNVVKQNVLTAIRKGVHVVIGTSGLSDEDFVEINDAASEHKVGIIAAGNFDGLGIHSIDERGRRPIPLPLLDAKVRQALLPKMAIVPKYNASSMRVPENVASGFCREEHAAPGELRATYSNRLTFHTAKPASL